MSANRKLNLSNRGELSFLEETANGFSKITLRGPAALAASYTITLPDELPEGPAFLAIDENGDSTFTAFDEFDLQAAYDADPAITLANSTPIVLSAVDSAILTLTKSGTGSEDVLGIVNAGAGSGLEIDANGTGPAISIDSLLGRGIFISHHSDTESGLRLDGDGDATLFNINQTGNATAALITSNVNQPCLKLIANGNSAALEIDQDDGEDSIVTNGDIRCLQVINELACNIAHTGALRFSDSVSVMDPSPDYFDVLTLDASDEIVLGNTTKDYPVRIMVDDAPITLETDMAVLLTASAAGGVAVGNVDFSVNANTVITAEGEVDCKMLSFESEASKTISSGAITVSSGQSCLVVDTQDGDPTDDLDTIAIDSSVEGNPILIIRCQNAARVVTLKDNSGNLRLAGDMVLDNTADQIVLRWLSPNFVELCRSNNS